MWGPLCWLRPGVGRAFPTLSVWETAPEREGCQRWKVPVWAGNPGQAPGSTSPSSSIHDEETNRSHVTPLNFISLFLCKRQRV